MLYSFGQYGGTVQVGARTLSVTGKTYLLQARAEGYFLSLVLDQVELLKNLLSKCPHLQNEKFIGRWLRATRLAMAELVTSGKSRFGSSLLGLRFDLSQSLGIELQELDEHLDALNPGDLRSWLRDASHKLDLASGRDEMGILGGIMRLRSVGDGGSSIEQFFASIVTNLKWKIDDVLKLTPAVLSTLLSDPDFLGDDLDMEQMMPDDPGDVDCKRFRKIYTRVAQNLIAGRRLDHET